jgi:hypothetical protein
VDDLEGLVHKKTVEPLAHLCRRPGITFTQRLDDSALGRVSARDKALEIVNCGGLGADDPVHAIADRDKPH